MQMTLDQVERLVKKNKYMSWNQWTLEIFKPDRNAFMRSNGAIRDGEWGLVQKVELNAEGMYDVPQRYAR